MYRYFGGGHYSAAIDVKYSRLLKRFMYLCVYVCKYRSQHRVVVSTSVVFQMFFQGVGSLTVPVLELMFSRLF